MFMLLDDVVRPTRVRQALRPVATRLHLHRFRYQGVEPFSNGSRYACRCGVVRCGF